MIEAPSWIYLVPVWMTMIICTTIIFYKWKPWEK